MYTPIERNQAYKDSYNYASHDPLPHSSYFNGIMEGSNSHQHIQQQQQQRESLPSPTPTHQWNQRVHHYDSDSSYYANDHSKHTSIPNVEYITNQIPNLPPQEQRYYQSQSDYYLSRQSSVPPFNSRPISVQSSSLPTQPPQPLQPRSSSPATLASTSSQKQTFQHMPSSPLQQQQQRQHHHQSSPICHQPQPGIQPLAQSQSLAQQQPQRQPQQQPPPPPPHMQPMTDEQQDQYHASFHHHHIANTGCYCSLTSNLSKTHGRSKITLQSLYFYPKTQQENILCQKSEARLKPCCQHESKLNCQCTCCPQLPLGARVLPYGKEVLNVNVQDGGIHLNDSDVMELRRALLKYHILVIRNEKPLTAEEQKTFTERVFGELVSFGGSQCPFREDSDEPNCDEVQQQQQQQQQQKQQQIKSANDASLPTQETQLDIFQKANNYPPLVQHWDIRASPQRATTHNQPASTADQYLSHSKAKKQKTIPEIFQASFHDMSQDYQRIKSKANQMNHDFSKLDKPTFLTANFYYWHCDGSFRHEVHPTPITVWNVVEGNGVDEILFTDLQDAYNRLDQESKQKTTQIHSIIKNPCTHSVHPLVKQHPLTGMQSLYLHMGLLTGFLVSQSSSVGSEDQDDTEMRDKDTSSNDISDSSSSSSPSHCFIAEGFNNSSSSHSPSHNNSAQDHSSTENKIKTVSCECCKQFCKCLKNHLDQPGSHYRHQLRKGDIIICDNLTVASRAQYSRTSSNNALSDTLVYKAIVDTHEVFWLQDIQMYRDMTL